MNSAERRALEASRTEITPARALRLCERYRALVPIVAALRQRRIEVAEIFREAQCLGDRPDAYGIRAQH
jgi:hypothetical protein